MGYIAGPNDDVTRLFEWYGGTIAHATEILGDPLTTTGAVVMGRRSFNLIDNPNGWVTPDGTALPWPVFVLTHQPQEKVTKGATTLFMRQNAIDLPQKCNSAP